MLEAHLPGPPLATWLSTRLGSSSVALWPVPDGRARARFKTCTRLLSEWTRQPSSPDAIVACLELSRDTPLDLARLISSLPTGGVYVEIARPRWGRWAAWIRSGKILVAAASRVRALSDHALVRIEQWSPIDPAGLLVTTGIRRPGG